MKLIRVAMNGIATYGVLLQGETPFAVTLERAWRNNEKGVSCIPGGTLASPVQYKCDRVKSPHFGDTFEVTGVPGRDEILFHKGNVDDDSHGCILVGEAFNQVLSKPGITASKEGFEEFLSITRMTDSFPLLVVDAWRT